MTFEYQNFDFEILADFGAIQNFPGQSESSQGIVFILLLIFTHTFAIR